MAGGSVHFGDVTACGHCFLAGADRLGGRSRLDGLVLGVPSNLVEVDRSRHDCNCLRAAGVDLSCLGKNLTDTVVTRQQHTLVMHGPYRWVRHPFYDSAALLAVAVSLIAANWFLFVNGVVMFCLFIIRARTEEENLVARFGDSYRAYMERTGRFLPRIRTTLRGA
jgi:Isoprenylcysteine carboxyl methyltransferase (ICMT) family